MRSVYLPVIFSNWQTSPIFKAEAMGVVIDIEVRVKNPGGRGSTFNSGDWSIVYTIIEGLLYPL